MHHEKPKTYRRQNFVAQCNPGRVHGRPPRPRSLCARARFARLHREVHIRGSVAAARLPWQQGGWQTAHAEGRSRRAQEAAQRRRYESGHRGAGFRDGKEARGRGRTGAWWQPAPAGRLLPHKSQPRA